MYAGRVQSAALRLLAQREEAIDAFKPVSYWTVSAQLSFQGDELQVPHCNALAASLSLTTVRTESPILTYRI